MLDMFTVNRGYKMTQTVEIIEMLEDSPSLGKVAAQIAKELNIPVSVVIEMLPKIFENNT